MDITPASVPPSPSRSTSSPGRAHPAGRTHVTTTGRVVALRRSPGVPAPDAGDERGWTVAFGRIAAAAIECIIIVAGRRGEP